MHRIRKRRNKRRSHDRALRELVYVRCYQCGRYYSMGWDWCPYCEGWFRFDKSSQHGVNYRLNAGMLSFNSRRRGFLRSITRSGGQYAEDE